METVSKLVNLHWARYEMVRACSFAMDALEIVCVLQGKSQRQKERRKNPAESAVRNIRWCGGIVGKEKT